MTTIQTAMRGNNMDLFMVTHPILARLLVAVMLGMGAFFVMAVGLVLLLKTTVSQEELREIEENENMMAEANDE